jgi:hypothetical protein
MNKRGMGGLGRGGGMGAKGNMTLRLDKAEPSVSSRLQNGWSSANANRRDVVLQEPAAPPATEEEARLAAFFNETSNQWEQTHEVLSQLVSEFFTLYPLSNILYGYMGVTSILCCGLDDVVGLIR